MMLVKNCLKCKKEFIKTGANQSYCCVKCRKQSYEKLRLKRYWKGRNRPLFKKCVICGKIFSSKDKFGRVLLKKYCSNKCANKGANYSAGNLCSDCKKLCSNSSRYCHICKYKHRDINGKNNPRYKKGLSAGYVMRISREAVLKSGRRLNVCEICGVTKEIGWYMIIHHIDRNRKNCNSENLQVLCSSCHVTVHQNGYKVKKICPYCNKKYMGRKTQIYCSKICGMKNRKIKDDKKNDKKNETLVNDEEIKKEEKMEKTEDES